MRLRFLWVVPVLALASGCATDALYLSSDFSRSVIEDYNSIGVKLSSGTSGKDFEIYGICAEDDYKYVIRSTSTAVFGTDGQWSTYLGDNPLYTSDLSYSTKAGFLHALSSLEVVKPAKGFSSERRMRVANAGAFKIPELCEAKQALNHREMMDRIKADGLKNDALIGDVVKRTGVKPMLGGDNQKSFNDLVLMFRQSGASNYQGKFVWVTDGDYQVSQVLDGAVVLSSAFSSATFPPITILTDKPALEGQFWSAVSHGPLQFIEPRSYQTVLGIARQTLVFKSI